LIAVADATNGITEIELAVFTEFCGKHAFTAKLDISKIKRTPDHRITEVKDKPSEPQRMQVLHDMCTMAKADGGITQRERRQLEQVADGLGILRSFICQSLDSNKELG
jgi:tellurite resistance protein